MRSAFLLLTNLATELERPLPVTSPWNANGAWRNSLERHDVGARRETLKLEAYHELKQYFLIVLYLWCVFSMFLVYKSVILNEEHISYLAHGFALINALILGKFVLIARALHLGSMAEDAPLIYPTLLKSAMCSIVAACCKILEEAAVGFFHHKSFPDSISDLGGGTLKGILTLTMLLFVILIPFFAFGELQRVIAESRLAQLFFRPRPPGQADLGRAETRTKVGQAT